MIENRITALIIEDDEDAISLLEIYLQAFNEIEIIDKITNPQKGLKALKKAVPNIVFLDIDMPELNGLEIAQSIKNQRLRTEIVFTTAYNDYAFNALNVEPLDYLIKPFGPEEIISVINHYKSKTKRVELERKMDLLMQNNNVHSKVKLPTRTGIILVNPNDVMLIRADSNYCNIYLIDGQIELITNNIYKTVSLLDSKDIIKANRSAYINIQHLKKIEKKTKTCYLNYKDLTYQESINRSSLAFIEQLNCFPLS